MSHTQTAPYIITKSSFEIAHLFSKLLPTFKNPNHNQSIPLTPILLWKIIFRAKI